MVQNVADLDRKLSSIFRVLLNGPLDDTRAEKVQKDFGAVSKRMMDVSFRETLGGLFDDFSQPAVQRRRRDAAESFACVLQVRDRGFVQTASRLFVAWCEILGTVDLERVLPIAPDAASLNAWMKAVQASESDVEKHLLANPVATYATAGADWLLGRGKPEQLFPLLELFLTKQVRPAYLRPWREALVATMKMDKKGVLLGAVLRHPWAAEGRTAALAEAARSNRALLRSTIDLLPALLAQKDAPAAGAAFVGEIFRAVVTTEGVEREFMTGALARLGTGVLLADQRGPQSEAALIVVASATQQLRNQTRDGALLACTWLLENLSHKEEPADGQLRVSIEGARHVALAIEKATQGFTARDILTVMARNLGLSLVGMLGEVVLFDPLRHEDLAGGLVPGVSVRIEEAGWAFGQKTLIRAKVKRAQGGSHV